MRKLIAWLVGLALVAAGGFYLLTDPAAYRLLRGEADLPANHAADIENGRILFFAGGCSSCHATPNQPDGTRLGRRLRPEDPVRHLFGPQHFPA